MENVESTWVATAKPKRYLKLNKDISVDAVIVGGGIAGTTAAYFLAQAGAKVALIDKGALTGSVSAYTTAFVRYIVDSRLVELKELFGEEKAKSVWQSSKEAVEMIGRNVQKEKIECEYLPCAFYKFANDKAQWQELIKDVDLATRYGFDIKKGVESGIKPTNAGYFIVENQAKFHPLKYLDALREKAAAAGALLFEDTEAKEIVKGDNPIIRTSGGTITAGRALIATYEPFNKPSELFAHKAIYTTYVLELKVAHGAIPEAMYEDDENPYHYLRVDSGPDGYDRAILGGEDHRHELPFDPRKAYAALEEYFKKILPGIDYEVVRAWSGPIIETIDGLPYIGVYDDSQPSLFVATGFSGSGMTFGTLSGHMFSEFAQGKPIPWGDTYDPRRKITPRQFWEKAKDYGGEFANAYVKNVFKDPGGRS